MHSAGMSALASINFYNSVDHATGVLWKANNERKPITGPLCVEGFARSPSRDLSVSVR